MNITNTVAVSSTLAAKRNALAEANASSYGAMRAYAIELNSQFAGLSVEWYAVEANDNGVEQNLIHAEKKELYIALHAAHHSKKHPNPSVIWARVRQYGAEEAGIEARANGEAFDDGESVAEASGTARHSRSLSLRMIEELSTLFKAGQKATRDGTITTKENEALTYVSSALASLGIDISSLK